jgi:hypothetical protein
MSFSKRRPSDDLLAFEIDFGNVRDFLNVSRLTGLTHTFEMRPKDLKPGDGLRCDGEV